MNPNNQSQDQIWGWQGKSGTIASRAKYIFGKDILSDVTFRVVPANGKATVDIKSHKFLLAMGSEVFETMFYGSLAEDTGMVEILDIDPEPFRLLLRYIYYDQIGPFDKSTAFPTLYAAKKYGVPILKNACEEYLKTNVATDNCLTWFVQAETYDEPNLASFCLEKVDLWGPSVLLSADFLKISIGVLKQILRRDNLKVKEADVYNAAIRWATLRCNEKMIACTGPNLRSELGEALFLVRFPIMTSQEVAAGPAKLGLLLSDEVNELFQFWFANEKLPVKFATKPRLLKTEIKISRFTGVQNGWMYREGSPDVIEFYVSSINKVANPKSVTISLVAVGLYLQNPAHINHGTQCTATMKIYTAQKYDGISSNVRMFHDNRLGNSVFELRECGNSWTIPATATDSNIVKCQLNKAFPIKEDVYFTMSIQILGMGQSWHGMGGMQNVIASVGSRNVTVNFRDAIDPVSGRSGHTLGYNHHMGSQTCGTTLVTKGQIPELYFEITEC